MNGTKETAEPTQAIENGRTKMLTQADEPNICIPRTIAQIKTHLISSYSFNKNDTLKRLIILIGKLEQHRRLTVFALEHFIIDNFKPKNRQVLKPFYRQFFGSNYKLKKKPTT